MQPLFEVAVSNALVAGALGLVVLAVSQICKRSALVHCLWLVVLVKLVTPPLFSVPMHLPLSSVPADVHVHLSVDMPGEQTTGMAEDPAVAERFDSTLATPTDHPSRVDSAAVPNSSRAASPARADVPDQGDNAAYQVSIFTGLVVVWVVGAFAFLSRSMFRIWQFRRLLKFAAPADSSDQSQIDELARDMGLKRSPQVLLLPGFVSPMLWGFGRRARLLLPEELMEELSDDAKATVIVHELAHYLRRDHWVRAFELVVSSLFWWHPVVWLAMRRIRQAEEECCDAWVVSQLPEHRGTYARTLVQTIGFISARPASMPAVAGVLGKGLYRSIEERVHFIMSKSPPGGVRMSPLMRFGFILFALVVLPLAFVVGAESTPAADGNLKPPANEPTLFAGSTASLGWIAELRVSPNGRLLAVGHGRHGGPGALSVWDLEKQELIASFEQPRRVSSVAFSRDGKLLAYGTMDNRVGIRRTDTLELVQELRGFGFALLRVAFSPDGKQLAVAANDIQFFDTGNWEKVEVELDVDPLIAIETFSINAIDYSSDGSRMLISGGNFVRGNAYGRAVIWDTQSGKIVAAASHTSRMFSALFSPDGKSFAVVADNGRVWICNAETGRMRRECELRGTPLYDVGWSPDGKQVVAVGAIKGYGVFDVETGRQLYVLGAPRDGQIRLTSASFTSDGAAIITGDSEKVISVWDTETQDVVTNLPANSETQTSEQPILAVATSPDGRFVAAAREDTTVTIHNRAEGDLVSVLEGHEDVVAAVAFSSTGMLASAGYDESIKLWDVNKGEQIRSLDGHENWVFGVASSPDGKTLASSGYDKTIRLWKVETGEQLAKIDGHTAAVRAVAFSPDGKHLASASSDRSVKIWDAATRKEVAELKGHKGTVRSIAFSPDGKTLASASEDGTAKIWSVADGKELHELADHEGMIWSVAFSAGGKNVATGGFDRTVKVWDPSSGQLRQTLQGHRDVAAAVAFAPDTSAIISGGLDRTLRIWCAVGAPSSGSKYVP